MRSGPGALSGFTFLDHMQSVTHGRMDRPKANMPPQLLRSRGHNKNIYVQKYFQIIRPKKKNTCGSGNTDKKN